jgi:protein-disulfide isomerase
MGSPNAKGVIVEFSDYECPFCARHATTVLPGLTAKFVEPGLVRYVLANNPLQMHPNARPLAFLAMCAGEQGRYWEMHDQLFLSKPDLQGGLIEAAGKEIGLDSQNLERCVESATYDRVIKRDQELAKRLGLVGTPAFALGRIENGNRVHALKLIRGAAPFSVFEDVLGEILSVAMTSG